MRDAFEERERSEEAKFKLDEELEFKVRCRRNKRVGIWAAERMGLVGDKAAAYASELVALALSDPSADAIIRRVGADFARLGVKSEPREIAAAVARHHDEALASVTNDYPTALGLDHMQIGG